MTRLFAGTPFDNPPVCETCGRPQPQCVCTTAQKAETASARARDAARLPPEKQTARVVVQKRKGNRRATVVEGLTAAANDLPALLKTLQAACGSGGSVDADTETVELQGDHADRVQKALSDLGYRVQ